MPIQELPHAFSEGLGSGPRWRDTRDEVREYFADAGSQLQACLIGRSMWTLTQYVVKDRHRIQAVRAQRGGQEVLYQLDLLLSKRVFYARPSGSA